ncbi:hypothetical protein ACFW04_013060 [Cataglyphis niger]
MQAESVNAQKCCTKYQMLKRTYRMINDHNRKSGNSRKTWEYYKCKSKSWMDPLTVADLNIETSAMSEYKKENRKEKNKKKKIPKIALMKKKLKRKAAEKRHSEKMQILN